MDSAPLDFVDPGCIPLTYGEFLRTTLEQIAKSLGVPYDELIAPFRSELDAFVDSTEEVVPR